MMVENTSINSLPLSSLPPRTREILKSLNSPKIIPSDGVIKLPRDWTGLAFLVNIFSELESECVQDPDPTGKVLETWQKNDETATVGELLKHLEVLDRYDVYDDIIEDLSEVHRTGEISGTEGNQIAVSSNNHNGKRPASDIDLNIYDDRLMYIHVYDAIMLYADEDKGFVAEMSKRLGDEGFQICTVDDLLIGQTARYAPVAQLISERCRRIILVFSPEFLNSIGMSFYMDYAQARSIESDAPDKKILPIMYRFCQLPQELRCYHKLFFQSQGRQVYDFWSQLKVEMARKFTDPKKQKRSVTTPPQISIDDLPARNSRSNSRDSEESPLLSLGALSASTSALISLDIKNSREADSQSLSNISQTSGSSDSKKKKSIFSKLALSFSWKNKKDTMDSD